MLQNVTMSFDLATALEVRSVHRSSRLTPNILRPHTPYVVVSVAKGSKMKWVPEWIQETRQVT